MPGYDDDEFDWTSVFGGGDPDFSELPEGSTPLFPERYSMGPDVNLNEPMGDFSGSFLKALQGLGGGGGDLLKLLGLGNGGLGALLPLLAGGFGAWNANNATKQGTKELQDAASKANDYAEKTIGGAMENFKPFIGTGTKANADLYALTQQPGLASMFTQPIKNRGGVPIRGSVTLAELAKR